MATELGVAYVTILPEMRGLNPAIRKELQGSDAPFREQGKRSGGIFATALGTAAGYIGAKGMMAAGAVVGKAFTGGLDRYMTIDTAQAKLRALGKSTEEITLIMKGAEASVKGTSFSLAEAANVASQAVASGIKPGKELDGVLTTIANTSAVAGVSMSDMGAIFLQVANKGKLQGDELLQLSERGVPAVQWLAQELNVTAGEVYKMASEGKINFETFERAMRNGMRPDAAKIMGDTLQGVASNMTTALSRLGETVISKFAPSVKGGMGTATDAINRLNEAAKTVDMSSFQLPEGARDKWEDVRDTFSRVGTAVKDDLWPPVRDLMDGFFDKEELMENVNQFLSGTGDLVGAVGSAAEAAIPHVAAFVGWLDRMTSDERREGQWDPAVTVNEWGRSLRQAVIDEFNKKDHSDPWTEYSNKAGRWLNEGFQNMRTEDDPIAKAGAWMRKRLGEGFTQMGSDNDPIASAGAFVRRQLVDSFTSLGTGDDPIARAGAWVREKIGDAVKSLGTGDDPVASAGAWLRQQIIDGFLGMGTGEDPVARLGAGVREWFQGVIDAAKEKLGIASPSTVFAQMASDVVDGFLGRFLSLIPNTVAGVRQWGEGMVAEASTKLGEMRDRALARFTELRTGVQTRLSEVGADVRSNFDRARDDAGTRAGELRDRALARFTELRTEAGNRFTEMRDNVSARSAESRDNASSRFAELRDNARNRFAELVSNAASRFTEVRDTTGQRSAELRDRVSARFSETRNNSTSTWSDWGNRLRSTTATTMDTVGSAISRSLTSIQGWFGNAVRGIGVIWGGLREATAQPARFVVNTVANGMISGWNTLVGLMEMDNLKINGRVTVPGLESGGLLPGRAAGPGDNLLVVDKHGRPRAKVRSREAVIPEDQTRKYWPLISDIIAGRDLPGLFHGGVIPTPGPVRPHGLPYYSARYAADMGYGTGSPVNAWHSGVVAYTKRLATSYGHHILLNHAGGLGSSLYAHLSRILVSAGQSVAQGQKIGEVGYTGNVRPRGPGGAHLHFEIRGGNAPIGTDEGGGIFDMLGQWITDKLTAPVKALIDKVPGVGKFVDLAKAMGTKALDAIVSKAQGIAPFGIDSGAPAGAGVERWRGLVVQALNRTGLPTSAAYVNAWLRQIQTESGGDPGAINLWDSNARAGDPSVGLVQVIGSTFARFRDKLLPNDRRNPLASLVAGMNWAKYAYPGRMLQKIGVGKGYADGVLWAPPGMAWTGEEGPELVQFRGGERVYSHPQSLDIAEGAARGGARFYYQPQLRQSDSDVRREIEDFMWRVEQELTA